MGRHGISAPDRHSPAPRSCPPRDRPTSPRWRRPRTSVAPTASCCRRRYAGCSGPSWKHRSTSCTTSAQPHARDPSRRRPPASPLRASEGCDQVVAAPPSRSAAIPPPWDSPCSSQGRWEPRRTSWQACPTTRPSPPPPTDPPRAERAPGGTQHQRQGPAQPARGAWHPRPRHRRRGLAEEKPEAYKDIDLVAETSEQAALARRVARLVPVGVVKGCGLRRRRGPLPRSEESAPAGWKRPVAQEEGHADDMEPRAGRVASRASGNDVRARRSGVPRPSMACGGLVTRGHLRR